jgi:hypothetical protein
VLYRASGSVGKPTEKDQNEIDQRPDLKTAEGEQLQQAGANLTD